MKKGKMIILAVSAIVTAAAAAAAVYLFISQCKTKAILHS